MTRKKEIINKVNIKTDSLIAKIGAFRLKQRSMALTFGNTIHLHNVTKDAFLKRTSWVCHELKHVEQFNKHGIIAFTIKYIYYSIRFGYYNNPLEKEARDAEKNHTLLQKYEIVK